MSTNVKILLKPKDLLFQDRKFPFFFNFFFFKVKKKMETNVPTSTKMNTNEYMMIVCTILFIVLVKYLNVSIVETSIIFYFLMYLYSGLQTFNFFEMGKFESKLKRLQSKACDGNFILELICSNAQFLIQITSLFQILSSLFIMYVILSDKNMIFSQKTTKNILELIFYSYYVFLVVVTLVYYHDKTIPILNNISLLMAMIIIHELWAKKL